MRNLESLTATLAEKPSSLVWGRRKKNADKGRAGTNEDELRETGYIGPKPAGNGGNR